MAALFSPSVQPLLPSHPTNLPNCPSAIAAFSGRHRRPTRCVTSISSPLCADESLTLDRSALKVAEAVFDEQLWAAARLRVRTFYEFSRDAYRIKDHKKFLAEREFEALKDRIAGKRIGFRKVSCINATLPLSQTLGSAADLCSSCKFSENGEDRVVVGSLDLNQCLKLADEISGKRPEGIRADFARGYLSNVCVAKELHRHGVGYALIHRSKKIACEWGITDLYAHVVVDNEAARKLYTKCDFLYESDEPAWQAKFLDRPRRLLLWADLTPLTNTL